MRYGYSVGSDMVITYYLITIVISIIVSCIFGAITKAINERKGYYGGFAWGFWLGWIGIIVVACRQSNLYYSPKESIIVPAKNADPAPKTELPRNAISYQSPNGDSWKCKCGRYNPRYLSSCVCGLNKSGAPSVAPLPEPQKSSAADTDNEFLNIAALKEYKALLDEGVITQEEFDTKKKEILSR